jgi:integrase
LGNKKLSAISYEDVIAVADKHPGEKRNILAVARTFFRWCVKPPRRYLPHSPLEGLELPKAKKAKARPPAPKKRRPLGRRRKGKGYPYGTILQLLQLTGQRRGEIANLRRPWINEKERTITLPDDDHQE